MGLGKSFDVNRVTNLETRATADEAVMLTNNNNGFQTIPNATVTGQIKLTGTTNALIGVADPAVNGQWFGIMQDTTFYNMAVGRFATGSKAIEMRSYFDNLTFRTGRSSTATSADMNFITNDQVVNGISANMNCMPRGWLNLCPNNGGLNTQGLQCLLVIATGQPALRSINTGISNYMVKWGSNGIHARNWDDSAFAPFYGSAFQVSSHRKFKENIQEFGESVLEKIKKTPVRKYTLKETQEKQMGLIYDEAPEELQSKDGETLQLYDTISFLWKAVQELTAKVEALEA